MLCGSFLQALQEGLPITIETCAHYLLFSSEDVPEGGVQYKCAPPLRSGDNRELLIDAVGHGSVAIVSSDHSPAPNTMKKCDTGDFLQAWGGISGLQYLLPAVNTVAQVRPCVQLDYGHSCVDWDMTSPVVATLISN